MGLLKKAEDKLRDATAKAEFGRLQHSQYVKLDASSLGKLEKKIQSSSDGAHSEVEALQQELEQLHKMLEARRHRSKREQVIYIHDQNTADTTDDKYLDDMSSEVEELEEMLKQMIQEGGASGLSHSDLKLEIEHLRESIEK